MELLVGALGCSQSEYSGISDTDGVWLDDEVDLAGLLHGLETVGSCTTSTGADSIALNRVLTVESELILTNDESILVLKHVVEDNLATLRDIDEVPLVDE